MALRREARMSRLKQLIQEIHRRSLWQVLTEPLVPPIGIVGKS